MAMALANKGDLKGFAAFYDAERHRRSRREASR